MSIPAYLENDPYYATVQGEVANEVLNEAKGRIITVLYQPDNSPEKIADLRARMAHVHRIQQALNCNDRAAIESIIAEWSERLEKEDAVLTDPYCQS